MEVAIDQASKGIETGNGEVGVAAVKDGELVFACFNTMNTTWDVTGHAEITALRHVSQALKSFDLSGHTIYCTLQPCTMCMAAIIWAEIDRVVYGATRSMVPAYYFDVVNLEPEELVSRSGRQKPALRAGVLGERCSRLYWDLRRTRL